jgi:hypothetical protein
MNMISTGAFLTEMDTTNKTDAVVSKLVSAWEKKNSKAARAGGVSLMALSLAACGSSDDDAVSYTQAQLDSAKTAATSAGISSALKDAGGVDHASVDAAITSNDATVSSLASAGALKAADGTVYASVDAAHAAGSAVSNSDAVGTALTDAGGTKHNNVDAAITSNDASITSAATTAAESSLLTAASSTFTTVAALQAAYNTASAPDGALSSTLVTTRDVLSLTGVSDTVTGAYGTLNATDIISDSTTTDADVVTAVFDLNSATTFTAVNVETINIDIRSATDTILDAVNISGATTINLYSNYGYNPTALIVDNIESGTTIDVSTQIGLASTEIVTLRAAANNNTSAVTLNMNGDDFTLATQTNAADDVDLLTINSGGAAANKVTLNATNSLAYAATNAESITITGDQNMTVSVVDSTLNSNLMNIIDNTTGGTTTFEVTEAAGAGASNDLTHVGTDVISLKGALHASDAFVVSSGARIDLDANLSNGAAVDVAISTAASSSSVTVNHDVTNTAGGSNDAHITLTEFNTVNFGNSSTAATTLDGNLALIVAGIGEEVDLNIATGKGLTITGTTAASTGTLDTVSISGTGAFVQTGAISAATINSTSTGNVTFTAALTGDNTVAISALKTLDMDAANTGSLTVTGAGAVDIEGAVGEASGIINFSNTGSSDITGDTTGTMTVAVSAGKTFDLSGGDHSGGNITISGAGNFTTIDSITGNVTTTTSGLIDLEQVIGDINATLTAAASGDELDISGAIVGDQVYSGSGNVDAAASTGTLTIGGSVAYDGSGLHTGALVANGSGTITLSTTTGSVSAASHSGAITVKGSTGQSGTIVTGSGDDSVTLQSGDNPVSITTNGGNDTIDAEAGAAAVSINAGNGVDTIIGSGATTDEMAGGNGTDTFGIENDDDGSFAEKITDFTVGSSGDVLRLDASEIDSLGTATMTSTTFTKVDTTDATSTTFADTQLIVLTGTQYADIAAVTTALNGSSGLAGTVGTDDCMIVVFADTDGHSYVTAMEGASNDFSATDAEIVQLSGLTHTNLALMTADNFSVI